MVVLPALTRNALLELRLGEDVDGLACTLAASFGCLVNAPYSGCSQKECAAAQTGSQTDTRGGHAVAVLVTMAIALPHSQIARR